MRRYSPTLLVLCACMGNSAIDVITPWTPPEDPKPETPKICELPAAKPVKSMLRLSNFEYQQLASDVLKTPVPATTFSRWVPVPAVFGFDTMSESIIDSQSLSEQLRTAEALTAQLLASPEVMALCPAVTPRLPAVCTEKGGYEPISDFSGTQGQACWSYLDSTGQLMSYDAAAGHWQSTDPGTFVWNTGMHPGANVDAIRRWTAPHDGSIKLTGEFRDADPGGGDGVTALIRRGGTQLWRAVLANASADTFDLELTVKRGDTFDFVVNRTGNPAYDTTAFNATIGFTAALNTGGWTWDNCAKPIVEHVANRMIRRPLRAEELADYQAMFANVTAEGALAEDPNLFWSALQTTVQAALITPSTLYKTEVAGALPPEQRGFETASRLSLFFCSSFPDDELSALAANGSLSDAKVVEAEARRLLDKCMPRFASNFAGQWMAYRARLDSSDTEPLTPSMRRESAEVFAALLSSGAKPADMLSPGFTLVDAPLAQHYGLDFGAVDGVATHRISTPKRGGIFTQGQFLTSTAMGSDFRRVIQRGIWTLNRVLCRQLPPLNAATREEIAASMMSIDPSLSLPERMKLHRDKGMACYTCHSQMDPIGLALEKFDAQALWRDTYSNGVPIQNDFKLDGVDVRDPSELSTAVSQSRDFGECVVTQVLTYGLNRSMTDEEKECTAEQMAYPLDRSEPTLKDLVVKSFLTSLKLTGGLNP